MKPRRRKPASRAKPKPMAARRADYGEPVDAFFAKQRSPLREILEALRALVEEAAPDATSSLKWGMPFYAIGGETVCAIGAHKAHVNLILPNRGGFDDPDGLLEGEGKTGKHLKVRSVDALPRAHVRRWLKRAAALARSA